jgi:hypothetical protein
MKTTEIFVEQVLIGFLALLVIAPLLWSDLPALSTWLRAKGEVVASLAAVGAAYLVGIVYDRLADTLLEDVDQHRRWTVVRSRARTIVGDPFPEGRWRLAMLRDGSAVTEHETYLRSRLRLSRALATLVPGLCLAYVLVATRRRVPDALWLPVATATPFVYGATLAFKLLVSRRGHGWTAGRVPKTYEQDAESKYEDLRRRGLPWLVITEPVTWGGSLLVLLTAAVAFTAPGPWLWLMPHVAIAATLLCGWAWWRINRTYLVFVRDAGTEITAERCPSGGAR